MAARAANWESRHLGNPTHAVFSLISRIVNRCRISLMPATSINPLPTRFQHQNAKSNKTPLFIDVIFAVMYPALKPEPRRIPLLIAFANWKIAKETLNLTERLAVRQDVDAVSLPVIERQTVKEAKVSYRNPTKAYIKQITSAEHGEASCTRREIGDMHLWTHFLAV